jgi:hypothetical protein
MVTAKLPLWQQSRLRRRVFRRPVSLESAHREDDRVQSSPIVSWAFLRRCWSTPRGHRGPAQVQGERQVREPPCERTAPRWPRSCVGVMPGIAHAIEGIRDMQEIDGGRSARPLPSSFVGHGVHPRFCTTLRSGKKGRATRASTSPPTSWHTLSDTLSAFVRRRLSCLSRALCLGCPVVPARRPTHPRAPTATPDKRRWRLPPVLSI